ncbi:MAG: hypothetical protein Kow00124_20230 [Anaerolineae bacterium]
MPAPEPPREYRPARPRRERGYHSLFWPIVLIGAGVVALLFNLGIVETINWGALALYWPLLLILAGVDVLFSRSAPLLGALLGLLLVGALFYLLLFTPPGETGSAIFEVGDFRIELPAVTGSEVQESRFTADLNDTQAAEITLDLSSGTTTVSALDAGSALLFEADVKHILPMVFVDTGGGTDRSITLGTQPGTMGVTVSASEDLTWDIGIHPAVETALSVDVASGQAILNLAGLTLTDFTMEGGAGRAEVSLPAGRYDMAFDVESGAVDVNVPAGASGFVRIEGGAGMLTFNVAGTDDLEIEVEGESGGITIRVPDDAAVRVIVRDSGSGEVSVPPGFDQVARGSDDEGTWQTPGFEGAADQIIITLQDVGSGSIRIEN